MFVNGSLKAFIETGKGVPYSFDGIEAESLPPGVITGNNFFMSSKYGDCITAWRAVCTTSGAPSFDQMAA